MMMMNLEQLLVKMMMMNLEQLLVKMMMNLKL
jgi:hypothetical protein